MGVLHPRGAKCFLQRSYLYLQTDDLKQKKHYYIIITSGMITMAATPDFDLFPEEIHGINSAHSSGL